AKETLMTPNRSEVDLELITPSHVLADEIENVYRHQALGDSRNLHHFEVWEHPVYWHCTPDKDLPSLPRRVDEMQRLHRLDLMHRKLTDSLRAEVLWGANLQGLWFPEHPLRAVLLEEQDIEDGWM